MWTSECQTIYNINILNNQCKWVSTAIYRYVSLQGYQLSDLELLNFRVFYHSCRGIMVLFNFYANHLNDPAFNQNASQQNNPQQNPPSPPPPQQNPPPPQQKS